jgi:hypothetical protein
MGPIEQKFLDMVEAFCRKWSYAPTEFGDRAVSDSNFLRDIQKGSRSPTLRTVDRVVAFMNEGGADRHAPELRRRK